MSGVFEPTFIGVNKSDTLYTLRRWKQYNARNWEGEGGTRHIKGIIRYLKNFEHSTQKKRKWRIIRIY